MTIERRPLNMTDEQNYLPNVKVLELSKEDELAQLKSRLDEIERTMGALTAEREAKGRRFQFLFSLNREVTTNLEIRAPIDSTLHVNEPDEFQQILKERFEHFHAH
jgi:hypothetical protein